MVLPQGKQYGWPGPNKPILILFVLLYFAYHLGNLTDVSFLLIDFKYQILMTFWSSKSVCCLLSIVRLIFFRHNQTTILEKCHHLKIILWNHQSIVLTFIIHH